MGRRPDGFACADKAAPLTPLTRDQTFDDVWESDLFRILLVRSRRQLVALPSVWMLIRPNARRQHVGRSEP
jgi:hypothetical protein